MSPARQIVLAVSGSMGDVHPSLAIGRGLVRRGHRVAIATVQGHRGRVEAAGLAFRPMGPHIDPDDPEVVRLAVDPDAGTENLFRKIIMPGVRQTLEDVTRAVADADLFVTTPPIPPVGPLVARRTGLRWASIQLSPLSFLSRHEPMEMFGHPVLSLLARHSRWVRQALVRIGRRTSIDLVRPLIELQAELGMAGVGHPMFEGRFSPHLVLALFSRVVGARQPDWPARTIQTGFCFHDGGQAGGELSAGLRRFLDAGPPPLVFTLGSALVLSPGSFYRDSAEVARQLGRRAVLLVGPREAADVPAHPDQWIEPYAPYSLLFPRAAAIVCSAGIGTVAQVLRAGRPALFIPVGHADQLDNAARCARLGAARVLPRARYRAEAARRIEALLADRAAEARAARLSDAVSREDGLEHACDALEVLAG